MDGFFDLLSTREWAMIIFIVAILAWVVTLPKPRRALGAVFKALIQSALLKVWVAALLYAGAFVCALYYAGLWQLGDLLATIFWLLTSMFILIVNFQKAKTEKFYYRNAMLAVFSLTSLFIFFTDIVNLSLWFWLLVIPFVTVLQLMKNMADREENYASVSRFLGFLETIVGFCMLFLVGQAIVSSWSEIATLETGRLFVLSAVLALGGLPFIYGLNLFDPYDRAFSCLSAFVDDPKLRREAKFRAFWRFGANVEGVERWRKSIIHSRPQDRSSLMATFEG